MDLQSSKARGQRQNSERTPTDSLVCLLNATRKPKSSKMSFVANIFQRRGSFTPPGLQGMQMHPMNKRAYVDYIAGCLATAKFSIAAYMWFLTSKKIVQVLIKQLEKGVCVKIVVDESIVHRKHMNHIREVQLAGGQVQWRKGYLEPYWECRLIFLDAELDSGSFYCNPPRRPMMIYSPLEPHFNGDILMNHAKVIFTYDLGQVVLRKNKFDAHWTRRENENKHS